MSEVHSFAHLAGAWKDDPIWDEFQEIVAENRRKDQELYNEQLDLEKAAEEIASGTKARWQIVKPERWDLIDRIGSLCSRQKMYSPTGSFSEGAMYISGFAAGRGPEVQAQLEQFTQWLAVRAYARDKTARNFMWWYYVQQWYPDDERAYAELPALFVQFQNDL